MYIPFLPDTLKMKGKRRSRFLPSAYLVNNHFNFFIPYHKLFKNYSSLLKKSCYPLQNKS